MWLRRVTAYATLLVVMIIVIATSAYAYEIKFNLISIEINGHTSLVNASERLLIPLFRYCQTPNDVLNVSIYVDPTSSLGIKFAFLISSNGSFIKPVGPYSPKYLSFKAYCKDVYALYITFGNYGAYPLEAIVVKAFKRTYVINNGDLNVTAPHYPGMKFLAFEIRALIFDDSDVVIKANYSMPISRRQILVRLTNFPIKAIESIYLVYSKNMTIEVRGVSYVTIEAYYYIPILNPNSAYIATLIPNATFVVIGAPWVKYGGDCKFKDPPLPLTPWARTVVLEGRCKIKRFIRPVRLEINAESNCKDVLITTHDVIEKGIPGALALNPFGNRTVKLVLSGFQVIYLRLNSIPANSLTVSIPLVGFKDVEFLDHTGKPFNGTVYLLINKTLVEFRPGVCVYPGVYPIFVALGEGLYGIGRFKIEKGISIRLPVERDFELDVKVPIRCPGIRFYVVAEYQGDRMIGELKNGSCRIRLHDIPLNSTIWLRLMSHGRVFAAKRIVVNESHVKVVLKPRFIRLKVVDLLGHEVKDFVVQYDGIILKGVTGVCMPINESTLIIRRGLEVYTISTNMTEDTITIRVFTLTGDSLKSIMPSLIAFIAALSALYVVLIRKPRHASS